MEMKQSPFSGARGIGEASGELISCEKGVDENSRPSLLPRMSLLLNPKGCSGKRGPEKRSTNVQSRLVCSPELGDSKI
jgi:hypothetical protein